MGLPENAESAGERSGGKPDATERSLNRKYWLALGMYLILALLAWLTLGEDRILVFGRPVEMRLVPLAVLGLFALRTYLAREADKIRREKAQGWEQGE
jgi:hypothetical protein